MCYTIGSSTILGMQAERLAASGCDMCASQLRGAIWAPLRNNLTFRIGSLASSTLQVCFGALPVVAAAIALI